MQRSSFQFDPAGCRITNKETPWLFVYLDCEFLENKRVSFSLVRLMSCACVVALWATTTTYAARCLDVCAACYICAQSSVLFCSGSAAACAAVMCYWLLLLLVLLPCATTCCWLLPYSVICETEYSL